MIRPEQLATKEPDGDDWYANLLVLERRKCLLLTHAETLFTIFEPDVRAPEGLPVRTFGDLGTEELSIAKTADRSVLGCMNDMAYLYEDAVARAGSLASTDVPSLNRHLRRNINSARDYQRPIDLVLERIDR